MQQLIAARSITALSFVCLLVSSELESLISRLGSVSSDEKKKTRVNRVSSSDLVRVSSPTDLANSTGNKQLLYTQPALLVLL